MWWSIFVSVVFAVDPWPTDAGNPQQTWSSPTGNWSHPLITVVQGPEGSPPNQPYSFPLAYLVLETNIVMSYVSGTPRLCAKPFVSLNPGLDWEIDLGPDLSTPAFKTAHGSVFVLQFNSSNGLFLRQFSAKDGSAGFVFTYAAPNNWNFHWEVDAYRIYITFAYETTLAISHSGDLLWAVDAPWDVGVWGIALSWDLDLLYVSGKAEYCCAVWALVAASGHQLWRLNVSQQQVPIVGCSPATVSPNGNVVVFSESDGYDTIVVIDGQLGQVKATRVVEVGIFSLSVGFDNCVYTRSAAALSLYGPDLGFRWRVNPAVSQTPDFSDFLLVSGDGSVLIQGFQGKSVLFTSQGQPIAQWFNLVTQESSWMPRIGLNSFFYVDQSGSIVAKHFACKEGSQESSTQVCVSPPLSLYQQAFFWVAVVSFILAVAFIFRMFTYCSLRKQGLLSTEYSSCSAWVRVIFCGRSGPHVLVDPAQAPLIDPYPVITKQLEEARGDLCRTYHSPDSPEEKLKALKIISKKGAPLIAALFRHELAAVPALFGALADGRKSEYDHLRGSRQPMLNPSAECLLMLGNMVQPLFAAHMQRVREEAKLPRCNLEIGPVKGEARLLEKMRELEEQQKDQYAVFDMNRATLFCVTPELFLTIIIALGKVFVMKKLKNKFDAAPARIKEPPCLFFQMGMCCPPEIQKFLIPDKEWIVELQITTPGIRSVKEYAHKFYEIDRVAGLPAKCVVCSGEV